MNEIINELFSLIELLKKSEIDAEKYPNISVKEAIDTVNDMISLLQFDDTDVLDKVAYLFVSGSIVYCIADANGWTRELKQIEDIVSKHIGYIRTSQQNDSAYFGKVKALSNGTYAGAPGRLTISKEKWNDIKRAYNMPFLEILYFNRARKNIQQRLSYGDAQPAIVISENPFIIAAYSDEMDAVVLLRFPAVLAQTNEIKLHDKLISVNCYGKSDKIAHDIFVGEKYAGYWTDFRPLIGDLLSDDTDRLNQHKNNIPYFMWEYVRVLGENYLRDHKDLIRNGFWFIDYI